MQHGEYKIKIKTWCITLYVAAVGFCLTPKLKTDYSKVYDFLPLIPVIFFWFLNAYKDYFSKQYQKNKRHDRINRIFNNLYDFSFEELKQ